MRTNLALDRDVAGVVCACRMLRAVTRAGRELAARGATPDEWLSHCRSRAAALRLLALPTGSEEAHLVADEAERAVLAARVERDRWAGYPIVVDVRPWTARRLASKHWNPCPDN